MLATLWLREGKTAKLCLSMWNSSNNFLSNVSQGSEFSAASVLVAFVLGHLYNFSSIIGRVRIMILFQGTLFSCLQVSMEVVFTLFHVILRIEAF